MNALLLATPNPVLEGPVAPVHLIRVIGDPAKSTVAGWIQHPWQWAAGIAAAVLLLALARWWYRRQRTDPAQLAFTLLGSRLHLTREERGLVTRLAEGSGPKAPADAGMARAPALALLLSQDAFIAAAESAARSGRKWAAPDLLTALHRKIFEPSLGTP